MPCSRCLVSSPGTLWMPGAVLIPRWRRPGATPIRKRWVSRRSQRNIASSIRWRPGEALASREPASLLMAVSRILSLRKDCLMEAPVRAGISWRPLVLQAMGVGGFFALQAFSQAWAGTATEAQQSASFLGDTDEIKSGFTLAFLLIFFSELGDKTFFIAAILASRKSNVAVFTGTFGALVAMTLISVVLGRVFHYIDDVLPFSLGTNEIPIDDLAAVVLLTYFGVSTLIDAASMEGSKAEEEQQEAELAVAGVNGGSGSTSNVVLATFALVFVAEWGDKSFFSTIALAAASSPVGVVAGAVAGHGAATLLAVLGGSIMGNYISERAIAYIGGTLFLVFAGETLVEILSGAK